jgi:glutaminyl-tRNA synthetase
MYKDVKPYDKFQFQRLGYFTVSDLTTSEKVVLFRTVTLTESKAKKNIDKEMKKKK